MSHKQLHSSLILTATFFAFAGLTSAAVSELKDAAGNTVIRYVVEAPEKVAPAGTVDPARQVGLILCFPEHDRPTGDEILPVREALIRLGLRDNYVLLAGSPQSRKFGTADHEPIEKLIAWAKTAYPINPRRIYMYGKGEGGKISGQFAMQYPQLVTAGITYSWGWWNMPAEIDKAIDPENSAPEFYMVLGLRDLSYHLTTVRDTYARVTAKGNHVIYREFEELGARTYHPPSNDDAIAWATRLRNKNIQPSKEEQQLLRKFSGAAIPAVNAAGYYTELALVGGVQAGQVLQKLLASGDAGVRAAAAETGVHAIFSEPTLDAVAKAATDPAPEVRRAAIRALSVNANWRSAAAQKALIDLAQPGKAVEQIDRVGAVDGIVHAVRLQVKGVRQDPALFQALVALLEDKDEELRVMAANTLAPVRDREFRGDLGRPERKTPEGGWDHWLAGISDKAAGYLKDYEVCGWGKANTGAAPLPGNRGTQEPVDVFCQGGAALLGYNLGTGRPVRKEPRAAFQYTLRAAEQGYVPAEAAVAMMYANGKGVEQSFAEAAKWWVKAAESGHVLAASHASMVYRGGGGVKPDAALSARWAKFAEEHTPALE